jgi:hypothetical protein
MSKTDCYTTAEVFGEGKSLDDVCAQWLTRFGQHQANALTEVVNLILRSTGSERKVEAFDIEDPDNCQARLTDIQEELQAVSIKLPYSITLVTDVCTVESCGLSAHREE